MKRKTITIFLTLLLSFPAILLARDIAPIVDAAWLEANLTTPGLTIVDIRKAEEYKEGHIPGAINMMYGSVAVKRNNLDNELPLDDDLSDILNNAGLTRKSRVIIYNRVDSLPERVNMTRVAWTLAYAGIENVAILDGGWTKWMADKKPASKDSVVVNPANETYAFNKKMIFDRNAVKSRLGKTLILDTRDAEFYFGASKQPYVDKFGRIKGATLLPSSWIFTKEGSLRKIDDLKSFLQGTVGSDRDKEIIVYCDSGRLSSGWWFFLTQVFDYKNVFMYDAGIMDYARDASLPVDQFHW